MNNYGTIEEEKKGGSTSIAQKLKDFTSKALKPSSNNEAQQFDSLN